MEKVGDRWLIRSAGHIDDNLWVDSFGTAACGEIEDGVAFEHGREGAWVVSAKDILELADKINANRMDKMP